MLLAHMSTPIQPHLLASFLRVVEEGTVGRAAVRVGVTQPALSRQIRQLEDTLAVRLFDRTGRGMRLTAAGATLVEHARKLLTDLDRLADAVRAQDARISGRVSFAIPPSLGAHVPADVAEICRHRYPDVELRVVVALTGAVYDNIISGRLDLGVVYHPVRSAHLQAEPLARETLGLVTRADEALSPGGPSLEEALREPLVLPSERHGLRRVVAGYAAREGLHLDVAVEADSLVVLLELVRRGVGRTLLPRRALEADLQAGTLGWTPVLSPRLERTTALARRRGPASPAVLAVSGVFHEVLSARS